MSALHPARPEDHDAIDAFLAPLTATSMFLRSNIRENGVTGGPAPFATRILDRSRRSGDHGRDRPHDAGHGPAADAGRRGVRHGPGGGDPRRQGRDGISAEAGQARAFRAAAGLEGGAALDKDEWLYELDLADLVVPAGDGTVRPPDAADVPLLERWRGRLPRRGARHPARGCGRAGAARHRGDVRRRDLPPARARRRPGRDDGAQREVPGWVQVGSVFTPPELRGSGIARRVVAGHLAELRDAGVRRAVLFASDPAARRVYETIGFRRQGSFALVLFPGPRPIGAGA